MMGRIGTFLLVSLLLVGQLGVSVAAQGSSTTTTCDESGCATSFYPHIVEWYNETTSQWEDVVYNWTDCGIKKGPNKGFKGCTREYLINAIAGDDGNITITHKGNTGNILLIDFLNGKPKDPWIEGNILKYATGFSDVEIWYVYMGDAISERIYIPHQIPITFGGPFNITLKKSENLQFTDPTMCDESLDCIMPEVFKDGDTHIFQLDGLWMNDAVYPVIIDPMTSVGGDTAELTVYHFNELPSCVPGGDCPDYTITNYPQSDIAFYSQGRNRGTIAPFHVRRVEWIFNISAVPYYATITNISFYLDIRIAGTQGNTNLTVWSMDMNRTWHGNTNTTGEYHDSTNRPDCTQNGQGVPAVTYLGYCNAFNDTSNGTIINWTVVSAAKRFEFNLTNLKDWYYSYHRDYGRYLTFGMGSYQGEQGTGQQTQNAPWGPAAADPAKWPRLDVHYDNCYPNGVTNWTVNGLCRITSKTIYNPRNTTIGCSGNIQFTNGFLYHSNTTSQLQLCGDGTRERRVFMSGTSGMGL